MNFPTNTVAPSIYTDFVNGIKFDICEVDSSCYHLLTNKRYRFFVCVEDRFICGYDASEKYFKATGEERWSFFCATKNECITKIDKFSKLEEEIKRHKDFIKRKPNFTHSRGMVVDKLKAKMLFLYGVHPQ